MVHGTATQLCSLRMLDTLFCNTALFSKASDSWCSLDPWSRVQHSRRLDSGVIGHRWPVRSNAKRLGCLVASQPFTTVEKFLLCLHIFTQCNLIHMNSYLPRLLLGSGCEIYLFPSLISGLLKFPGTFLVLSVQGSASQTLEKLCLNNSEGPSEMPYRQSVVGKRFLKRTSLRLASPGSVHLGSHR